MEIPEDESDVRSSDQHSIYSDSSFLTSAVTSSSREL